MSALRLKGISKVFGGVRAIDGIDLDVAPGERHALLGPNGAGKTTLFNVVTGDLSPTSGVVEFHDRDITLWSQARRTRGGLARTYQISRLMDGMSVVENLQLARLGVQRGHYRAVRLPRIDLRARRSAEELAARVGLVERRSSLVVELSHGEQRQLELGMALASEPRLLLLDEPAAGLAPNERKTLTSMLLALDRQVTVVLIEHDMDIALRVSDRVTLMHDGRVMLAGTPAEIGASSLARDLYLGTAHAQ